MAAGVSLGPEAWWTTPGLDTKNADLTQSAPAGYYWDPVQQRYVSLTEKNALAPSGYKFDAATGQYVAQPGGGGYSVLNYGAAPPVQPINGGAPTNQGPANTNPNNNPALSALANQAMSSLRSPSTPASYSPSFIPGLSMPGQVQAPTAPQPVTGSTRYTAPPTIAYQPPAIQALSSAAGTQFAMPSNVDINSISMPPIELGQIGSAGGGDSLPSPESLARVPEADSQGAMAASFARAKDTAGQLAAASLRSLRDVFAGRGMLGSGNEGEQSRAILQAGAGQLGDVSREQAIQSSAMRERENALNYQGAIQQRGQSIDMAEKAAQRGLDQAVANANLRAQGVLATNSSRMDAYRAAIEQRGQNISALQTDAQRQEEAALQAQRLQQESALAALQAQLQQRSSDQQASLAAGGQQQQLDEFNSAGQWASAVTGYQGGIQQRQQDIAAAEAQRAAQMAQDQANYQEWYQQQQLQIEQQQQQQAAMLSLMRFVQSAPGVQLAA
jgi:hypothetical protein